MSDSQTTLEEEQSFIVPAYTPELREELIAKRNAENNARQITDQLAAAHRMAQALHIYLSAGHKEAREDASIVA